MKLGNLLFIPTFIGLSIFIPFPVVRYLLFAFTLVVLLSFFYSLILGWSIKIEVGEPTIRTFPGQKASIRLILRNRGPFPSGSLWVDDPARNLEVFGTHKSLITLPPFSSLRIQYEVRSQHRGVFTLGPVNLEFADPGLFFPHRSKSGEERELLVYPRSLWKEEIRWTGLPPGSRKQNRIPEEDLFRIRNLREYQPGDPLRNLSPQVSARLGRPITRIPELNEDKPVLILLDLEKDSFPLRMRTGILETLLGACSGLLHAALELDQEVALATNGDCPMQLFSQNRGKDHIRRIMENLARVDWADDGGVDWLFLALDTLRLSPGLTVFYLGPSLTSDMVMTLELLRRRSARLVHLDAGGRPNKEYSKLENTIVLGGFGDAHF